ncbi:MAG: hypothetical protein H6559_37250 [Lewinellaceae bacterium]|nr:hypothetical protein [Lewinellaceae bacterium]
MPGEARLKALAFLFSMLFLLSVGKAFGPEGPASPEWAAAAYQVHTQACKAAAPAPASLSVPDIIPFPRVPAFSGLIFPFISTPLLPAFLPGQVSCACVFTPAVKRCILFSCLKMGDSPFPETV